MTQFDPSMVAEMLMRPVSRETFGDDPTLPVEPEGGMIQPLESPSDGFFKEANIGNQDLSVPPGMIVPFERTSEGRLQFATPQLVSGLLEGLQQAGDTIQKGMSGDPMFIPVDGKLSDQAIDEISNLGLTLGGTAYTGSSLLPGLVPEGSLGVFAGRQAKTFPDVQLKEKMNESISKYNDIRGELNQVSNELSKGRFAMDENIYQDLTSRQSELVKKADDFIESGAVNEQSFFKEYDAKLNQTTPFSFFKDTEREYGKGLFKLPDNKYRFEISDVNAKINLNIDDSVDAFSGPKTTSFELEEIIPYSETGTTKTLSEVLDHPELFEAYPQLKDHKLKFYYDTDTTVRGAFRPQIKTLEVNLASFMPIDGAKKAGELKKDIKDVLVHEVQHAIQEIEGFSKGANPADDRLGLRLVAAEDEQSKIIRETTAGAMDYKDASQGYVNFSAADRIKYYQEKSLLTSHQPRLLFNQSNWYKYGDKIRQEIFEETGLTYKKRKTPDREKWISLAFEKLAKFEINKNPTAASLAKNSTRKEIKSALGKRQRIIDKNYDAFAQNRNAERAFSYFRYSQRYKSSEMGNFNIYEDTLGEAEARAVQARAEGGGTTFPLDQFQEGKMRTPPPEGNIGLLIK